MVRVTALFDENGREDRIRTCDPCAPSTVLYQAELLPDRCALPSVCRGSSAGRTIVVDIGPYNKKRLLLYHITSPLNVIPETWGLALNFAG